MATINLGPCECCGGGGGCCPIVSAQFNLSTTVLDDVIAQPCQSLCDIAASGEIPLSGTLSDGSLFGNVDSYDVTVTGPYECQNAQGQFLRGGSARFFCDGNFEISVSIGAPPPRMPRPINSDTFPDIYPSFGYIKCLVDASGDQWYYYAATPTGNTHIVSVTQADLDSNAPVDCSQYCGQTVTKTYTHRPFVGSVGDYVDVWQTTLTATFNCLP